MVGITLNGLLSAIIQLMWVSLLSACNISISVHTICQSMTYYNFVIILKNHVIDLIYGNCLVCMLNNAWHVQLMFWMIHHTWIDEYQTCKLTASANFLYFYKHFYNVFFPLTLHLFVVLYRLDGLYKMIRRRIWGGTRIYIEDCLEGPKVPWWGHKGDHWPRVVA